MPKTQTRADWRAQTQARAAKHNLQLIQGLAATGRKTDRWTLKNLSTGLPMVQDLAPTLIEQCLAQLDAFHALVSPSPAAPTMRDTLLQLPMTDLLRLAEALIRSTPADQLQALIDQNSIPLSIRMRGR